MLEMRGLGYDLPDGRSILNAIDMTLNTGEVVALLGPSGAGKTTFLRLAAGLIPPTRGTVITAAGHAPRPGRDTVLIFQDGRLLDFRTALGNVMLVMSGKDKKARAYDILTLVGLDASADAYPPELSGGMRQRLSLARACATPAPVLLLDEPFASLDYLARQQLQDLTLALLRSANRSAILVTHSIEEALVMADRIFILHPLDKTIVTYPVPDLGPRGSKRREISSWAHALTSLTGIFLDIFIYQGKD